MCEPDLDFQCGCTSQFGWSIATGQFACVCRRNVSRLCDIEARTTHKVHGVLDAGDWQVVQEPGDACHQLGGDPHVFLAHRGRRSLPEPGLGGHYRPLAGRQLARETAEHRATGKVAATLNERRITVFVQLD